MTYTMEEIKEAIADSAKAKDDCNDVHDCTLHGAAKALMEKTDLVQTLCHETIALPTNGSEFQAGQYVVAAQILRAINGEGEYGPEWLKMRRKE